MSGGILQGPIDGIAAMVAHSTVFQTLCGVTTSADAAKHVYYPGVALSGENLKNARPFVYLSTGKRTYGMPFQGGAVNTGSVILAAEANIPDSMQGQNPTDWQSAEAWANAWIEGLWLNLFEISHEDATYPMIQRIDLVAGPYRTMAEDVAGEGSFYGVILEISYGVGG